MSSRQPGRHMARSVGLVGLAVAGLVLSGCASTGIHPGSAAVIGDQSLSMSKVDTTATRYCRAYEPQISQQSQRVPMRYLRQFVAANLSQRMLGEQLAQEYGVQPTSQYAQQVDKVEQTFASASSELRNAVVDVEAGGAYLSTVQVAIGQKLLAESGTPAPTAKAALQRGQVATEDWLKTHSISIDPVFGISADGGQFKTDAGQTSYPLSTLASQGAAAPTVSQPDPAYTAALSPSQVCG
jgi:peptidyl-prolyl cis-trans isomerase SurA